MIVLVIILIFMLGSSVIICVIGLMGVNIISWVMGFILVLLVMINILVGIMDYFGIVFF